MNKKIAVAMSVYSGDTLPFLSECITSILNQTYTNFDIYIEVDGVISKAVNDYLLEFNGFENVFVNFNNDNLGLATRLNCIIKKCLISSEYSFLARMDADDICEYNRFDKQVEFLVDNKNISVVGSDVIEISERGDFLYYKRMRSEHEQLLNEIIKKCPLNHPSVMFDMGIFEEGFRYKPELLNTQDYYLWIDLLAAGKKFANINEPLLKFRVNDEFHSRRGLKKAINDFRSRVYAFKHLNALNVGNVVHTLLLLLLRIAPSSIKSMAYKFLR